MRKAGGTVKPNFDRDGKLLRRSLVSWILLLVLGAYSRKRAIFRYLLLMIGAALVKTFLSAKSQLDTSLNLTMLFAIL
jgi:beta-apo-4'-carotenal oxygenase